MSGLDLSVSSLTKAVIALLILPDQSEYLSLDYGQKLAYGAETAGAIHDSFQGTA